MTFRSILNCAETPTMASGGCNAGTSNARSMQASQDLKASSTKEKQAACDRESSFDPESEDEEPAPETPSSPEVPLKLLHAHELQMTLTGSASKKDTSLPPLYERKTSIPTLETLSKPVLDNLPMPQPTPKDLSKPQLYHQPPFDPRNPFTQMHMRKPRPPKTKPATKAAPPPPAKKAAPSRPAHESPWAKTTPHKKRGQRPAPPPVGSRICYWDGCGMPVPDGRFIWDHIKEEHNSGRPVRVGVKVKTYKGNGGGKGMAKVEIPLKREIDEDYDAPELEEGEILDMDRQDDALEDEELDPAILDALEGKMPEEVKAEEIDERVPVEVEPVRSLKSKTEQWFDRVVCRWGDCDRDLQFIGLQRHVETKHIPLRGAWCPKGCGRHVARSDMLWRHVENCRM